MPIRFLLKILPKNLKPIIVGVPVIIRNSKYQILMGKRNKKMVFYGDIWGLPGGLTMQGEKIEDAAKREVKEELDVDIKILKKSKNIYEILPSKKSPVHSLSILFYGEIISGKPSPKNETQDVRWFNPKEILEMDLAYNHKEILRKEGLI